MKNVLNNTDIKGDRTLKMDGLRTVFLLAVRFIKVYFISRKIHSC